MPKSNYCLIDPNGGAIKVQITANNGIRTGSIFILWEIQQGKWVKKEKFQAITGDDGLDEFILLEKPQDIENDSLAWSINACSLVPSVQRGEFTIVILQDTLNRWKKLSSRIVPSCSHGKQLTFGNHVIFKHLINDSLTTSALWKDIE